MKDPLLDLQKKSTLLNSIIKESLLQLLYKRIVVGSSRETLLYWDSYIKDPLLGLLYKEYVMGIFLIRHEPLRRRGGSLLFFRQGILTWDS